MESSDLGGILDPEVRREGGEEEAGAGWEQGAGTGRDWTRGVEAGTVEPGERESVGRGGKCGDAGGARVAEPPRSGRPVWRARGMSQGPPAGSVLQRSVAVPGNRPQVVDTRAGCGDRVRVRAELQVSPRVRLDCLGRLHPLRTRCQTRESALLGAAASLPPVGAGGRGPGAPIL